MRIALVTSNSIHSEPRAPRTAYFINRIFPTWDIDFICYGHTEPDHVPKYLRNISKINIISIPPPDSLCSKFVSKFCRLITCYLYKDKIYKPTRYFWEYASKVDALLKSTDYDIAYAFGIQVLQSVFSHSRHNNTSFCFDMMEFYPDMGDASPDVSNESITTLLKESLRFASLVTTTSRQLAEVTKFLYSPLEVEVLYNQPWFITENSPRSQKTFSKNSNELSLYWRNSWIAFSQRGLEDVLFALSLLPYPVKLYIQGRIRAVDSRLIARRIHDLKITSRVTFLGPYEPDDAVAAASLYDIGLCLERPCCANHNLTVSNKLFDYLSSGLAVVVPSLPSLASIVLESGAGVVYEAGNPVSLADKINHLFLRPELIMLQKERAVEYSGLTMNVDLTARRVFECLQHTKQADN